MGIGSSSALHSPQLPSLQNQSISNVTSACQNLHPSSKSSYPNQLQAPFHCLVASTNISTEVSLSRGRTKKLIFSLFTPSGDGTVLTRLIVTDHDDKALGIGLVYSQVLPTIVGGTQGQRHASSMFDR